MIAVLATGANGASQLAGTMTRARPPDVHVFIDHVARAMFEAIGRKSRDIRNENART